MNKNTKPVRNWDRMLSPKEILVIGVIFIGVLLLIGVVVMVGSAALDPVGGNPYGILQRHVFEAFSGREAE